MNATEMIRLMNRQSFLPMQIRLNDGTMLKVEEPYMIGTSPNSPTCIVHEHDGTFHFVSYRNIAGVVLQNTSTNGS